MTGFEVAAARRAAGKSKAVPELNLWEKEKSGNNPPYIHT
jgi:hypothetical protein